MRRSLLTPLAAVGLLAAGPLLAACGDDDGDDAAGTADCDNPATVTDGVLTIATGEPAFPPYVIDDDPTNKQGFEAAVAYAVAGELGFADDAVTWVRTGFDEVIAPGPKDFDFNLQQFSITEERAEQVSFSDPYYESNQALVAGTGSAALGATTIDDLKQLKLGAATGTTSFDIIAEGIEPEQEPNVYDDNAAAIGALQANQIDGIVLDLPTALYVAAVEIDGGTVVAQFPFQEGGERDRLGLLLEKDNPLVECVNAALATLRDSGELQEITDTWLVADDVAPIIELD